MLFFAPVSQLGALIIINLSSLQWHIAQQQASRVRVGRIICMLGQQTSPKFGLQTLIWRHILMLHQCISSYNDHDTPVLNTTILQGGIQWSSRPRHHQTSARHCSHIIINESFRAYFRRILNSCLVLKTFKVSTVNRWCPPSQRHVFSARLLFDKIFA